MTTAYNDKPDEPPQRQATASIAVARSLQHLLLRASRFADERLSEALVDQPVTSRQIVVIDQIRRHPGINQTELVANTGIDRSTLSNIVIRLNRQGLLTCRRSKTDARAHVLLLTPRGLQIANAVAPIVQRIDNRMLSRIPKAHRELFLSSLDALTGTTSNTKPGQS